MQTAFLGRRSLIVGLATAAGTAALPAWARSASEETDLAEDAFIRGLPLVLMKRYLVIATKLGIARNRFALTENTKTPRTHSAGSQTDMLYGLAWLDLTSGPQVIEAPDTADRYYSMQLMDMYANSFAYIGRRSTGTKRRAFAVTRPGYEGSVGAGITEIRATTDTVFVWVRTFVRDPADLAAARAVHFAYTLGSLASYPADRHRPSVLSTAVNPTPIIDLSSVGSTFFDELESLLPEYPPSADDGRAFAALRPWGSDPHALTSQLPGIASQLDAAAKTALARLHEPQPGWTANGWTTILDVIGFIRDPILRARTVLYGPATQIADEALYFSAKLGPDGAPLSGENRYVLRFSAGKTPPVDAFWSLGLYDPDGFLYDNPLARYSISDRTPGLRFAPDGALEILIQHKQPPEGPANWLPAPADGFRLTLRAYQPRNSLLNRSYSLPPLRLRE